jgi:hypothetical protein
MSVAGAKRFQATGKLRAVCRGSGEALLKDMGAVRFLERGDL